jgi:hypothetical protein
MRMKKGKEKRGKDLRFNPTDYDYMDSLPMEGWIWEFIRRSPKYRDLHEKWMEDAWKPQKEKDLSIIKEYVDNFFPLFPWSPEDPSYSAEPLLFGPRITKLNPIRIVNLQGKSGFNRIGEGGCFIPHPPIKKEKKELSNVSYAVNYPPIEGDYPDNYYDADHPVEILFNHQGQKNILMVLIDLSTPQSVDELLRKLRIQLLGWRKALKLPKARSPKTAKRRRNVLIGNAKIWKSYLMVYDLITAGYSIEKASDELSKHDDFYSESKNIENHFNKAKALINGGYKKFI